MAYNDDQKQLQETFGSLLSMKQDTGGDSAESEYYKERAKYQKRSFWASMLAPVGADIISNMVSAPFQEPAYDFLQTSQGREMMTAYNQIDVLRDQYENTEQDIKNSKFSGLEYFVDINRTRLSALREEAVPEWKTSTLLRNSGIESLEAAAQRLGQHEYNEFLNSQSYFADLPDDATLAANIERYTPIPKNPGDALWKKFNRWRRKQTKDEVYDQAVINIFGVNTAKFTHGINKEFITGEELTEQYPFLAGQTLVEAVQKSAQTVTPELLNAYINEAVEMRDRYGLADQAAVIERLETIEQSDNLEIRNQLWKFNINGTSTDLVTYDDGTPLVDRNGKETGEIKGAWMSTDFLMGAQQLRETGTKPEDLTSYLILGHIRKKSRLPDLNITERDTIVELVQSDPEVRVDLNEITRSLFEYSHVTDGYNYDDDYASLPSEVRISFDNQLKVFFNNIVETGYDLANFRLLDIFSNPEMEDMRSNFIEDNNDIFKNALVVDSIQSVIKDLLVRRDIDVEVPAGIFGLRSVTKSLENVYTGEIQSWLPNFNEMVARTDENMTALNLTGDWDESLEMAIAGEDFDAATSIEEQRLQGADEVSKDIKSLVEAENYIEAEQIITSLVADEMKSLVDQQTELSKEDYVKNFFDARKHYAEEASNPESPLFIRENYTLNFPDTAAPNFTFDPIVRRVTEENEDISWTDEDKDGNPVILRLVPTRTRFAEEETIDNFLGTESGGLGPIQISVLPLVEEALPTQTPEQQRRALLSPTPERVERQSETFRALAREVVSEGYDNFPDELKASFYILSKSYFENADSLTKLGVDEEEQNKILGRPSLFKSFSTEASFTDWKGKTDEEKEINKLLASQIIILHSIGIPGFDRPTIHEVLSRAYEDFTSVPLEESDGGRASFAEGGPATESEEPFFEPISIFPRFFNAYEWGPWIMQKLEERQGKIGKGERSETAEILREAQNEAITKIYGSHAFSEGPPEELVSLLAKISGRTVPGSAIDIAERRAALTTDEQIANTIQNMENLKERSEAEPETRKAWKRLFSKGRERPTR